MKCPECDATQFAGFNGFVLCAPEDPSAPVHRLSNDAFNERLAAFEAGTLVEEAPRRRSRKAAPEPEPEPETEPPAEPVAPPE